MKTGRYLHHQTAASATDGLHPLVVGSSEGFRVLVHVINQSLGDLGLETPIGKKKGVSKEPNQS